MRGRGLDVWMGELLAVRLVVATKTLDVGDAVEQRVDLGDRTCVVRFETVSVDLERGRRTELVLVERPFDLQGALGAQQRVFEAAAVGGG